VFFLRSQAEQMRRLEKKVEREKIVLAGLPELSLQILQFAREHGRVTMMDAIKLTGASRNTLKQHFRDLTERKHLEQYGRGRGVWLGVEVKGSVRLRVWELKARARQARCGKRYPCRKTNGEGSMATSKMTAPQARLELALWQADADATSSRDLYIRLTEMGLPPEVAIRLKDLLEFAKPIGDKLVSLGKIIVIKLIEFIEAHPNLATGIALGAAVSSLIAAIPFLGPILAPIALPLGIAVGAVTGHRMDIAAGGAMSDETGFTHIAQDAIEIARAFFQLLIDTMMAISAEFSR